MVGGEARPGTAFILERICGGDRLDAGRLHAVLGFLRSQTEEGGRFPDPGRLFPAFVLPAYYAGLFDRPG
ncbi:hypothetical protein D3C72_1970890 [compost metagenome]